MRRIRLLVIVVAVAFVLGMFLWLADFVLRAQAAIALFSPLLAQLFLIAIFVLIVAAIGFSLYNIRPFLRPKRQARPVEIPQEKIAATRVAISGVEQQITQIQSEVARQALQEKLHALTQDWQQRDIRIVLFGVGSVGKTSIVNGLLGDFVGQVDAPMGTTTVAATYPLRLIGIDQTLWLTDTPGLLEASEAGPQREAQVRHLATEADLVKLGGNRADFRKFLRVQGARRQLPLERKTEFSRHEGCLAHGDGKPSEQAQDDQIPSIRPKPDGHADGPPDQPDGQAAKPGGTASEQGGRQESQSCQNK